MAELRRFCTELGVDEDRARSVLATERGKLTSALATPWYVRLVVAAGAWVTAITAIALGVALVFQADPASPQTLLFMLGAAYVVAGLLLLRKATESVFATQLGAAGTAAGTAMIAAAALFEFEGPWPACLASAAVTAIIVITTSNRTLEFLAALLTAIFFVAAILDPLADSPIAYYRDIIALTGVAGVILMLSPPRRDLRPIAIVLLLVFPIFDWFSRDYYVVFFRDEAFQAGGLVAKLLYVGLFLGLAAIHWQRAPAADVRIRLTVFGVTAVVVGLLLPAGGAAALMIMMLAFVLGSRPLALLGTLLEINYIWRFYYDIELTLLVKSGILVAVGAALLIAWWQMAQHAPDGVDR